MKSVVLRLYDCALGLAKVPRLHICFWAKDDRWIIRSYASLFRDLVPCCSKLEVFGVRAFGRRCARLKVVI